MNSKNDRNRPSSAPQSAPASPRKRFRIEKLEERIAPSKGGKGTHNCGGSVGASSGLSGGSIY